MPPKADIQKIDAIVGMSKHADDEFAHLRPLEMRAINMRRRATRKSTKPSKKRSSHARTRHLRARRDWTAPADGFT